jgi:serine/threonine-protein phosphatase Stp1
LGLWAVADGAGGHDAGEVASAMLRDALAAIPAGLAGTDLVGRVRQAVGDTHTALVEEAARRGPSTVIASTIAVLLVRGEHFACLWAGDSRVYLLREQQLQQVSRDHSLVQELVDAGLLRPEDAEHHPRANIITRAVGAGPNALELDKVTGRVEPGDRFLLCSDGLFKAMGEIAVESVLISDGAEESSPAERLIAAALANHASDNVTAIVVAAEPDGSAALH